MGTTKANRIFVLDNCPAYNASRAFLVASSENAVNQEDENEACCKGIANWVNQQRQ